MPSGQFTAAFPIGSAQCRLRADAPELLFLACIYGRWSLRAVIGWGQWLWGVMSSVKDWWRSGITGAGEHCFFYFTSVGSREKGWKTNLTIHLIIFPFLYCLECKREVHGMDLNQACVVQRGSLLYSRQNVLRPLLYMLLHILKWWSVFGKQPDLLQPREYTKAAQK